MMLTVKNKLYNSFKFDTILSKTRCYLILLVTHRSPLNPSLHPSVQVPLTLLHVLLLKQFPHALVQFSP